MAGQGGGLTLIPDAGRKRRYGFALTPLADAMFQLLIFFMLSSTLSPYSLIALTGGAPAGQSAQEGPADMQAEAPVEAARSVTWQLSRGQIRAGQQVMPLEDLRGVLPVLREERIEEVLIFPTRSARVQDIATVLELLGSQGITKVRLIGGSRVEGG
ncbi:ExbD/TolR family protein [Szabonella alba]|uniref:Biopolymer transporter ExbD n=1 Tax=Szabonella alba TaxID=2804194 RepID=A0A8K0VDZ0_9RHOB|nr:biopolymer transporter ExbD [Szabonella alba]MBL4917939.1 biopolymer transporter ExbD [Szabonella alba]